MIKLTIKESLDMFNEMARIGWVPYNEPNSIEVYVHTNDAGNIPHFHVRKYSKHGKFEWETYIKYEVAEYFKHGKYKDNLPDKKTAKELDKMLRQIDPKSRHRLTFWEVAIDEWNRNNSDKELPLDLEQPNYCTLK